jgi:putative membrane protein
MSELGNTKSREHLANERTFLAWIRTGIALMGLGFIVVKFALFLKEILFLLNGNSLVSTKGYSALVGVALVALGVLVCLLAFWQFKRVENQIKSDTYLPSSGLSILLTLSILIGGIFLIIYLLPSI